MARSGKVYLVGAGPGDPGLLSVKGLWCLKQADLVLYDGLVNPLLLRHTAAQALRTCRSDSPSGRVLDQAEINQRLIAAAREGKTVVRLKGGDPFIFGRGGEEARALADAGIDFEVVPGITAAIAAGEYAGISFTHREYASAVAFVTGHEDPAKDAANIDYAQLAAFRGTLVFYMGLHRLEGIANALLQAGKPADTPACVISSATTPRQKTVVAPLCRLAESVRAQGLRPPSLIVIGPCVEQRARLAWFEKLPLFGKVIGITRPEGQADAVIAKACALGAQPVLLPTIEIRPVDNWSLVDRAIARMSEYDWVVFTSANGVRALLGRIWETGKDTRILGRTRIAAIGTATAEALAAYSLKPDLVPPAFRAEALAESLSPHVTGKRVLWARASRGRDVLPKQLAQAGATVEELVVYQNVDVNSLPPAELAMIEAGRIDWICISSPSIARSLQRLLTPPALARMGTDVRLASISPVTTAAAREVGLPIAVEARVYTWDGLFDALLESGSLDHPGEPPV